MKRSELRNIIREELLNEVKIDYLDKEKTKELYKTLNSAAFQAKQDVRQWAPDMGIQKHWYQDMIMKVNRILSHTTQGEI